MVFGTQTTGRPLHQSWWEICRLPSPPMETSASKPLAWNAATRSSERSISNSWPSVVPDDVAEGIAAVGGAEDGAAEVGDPADLRGAQRHDAVEGEQSLVAPLDPVAPPARDEWAESTTARMTALSPGASPPPVEMAIRIRMSALVGPDPSTSPGVRVPPAGLLGEDQLAVDLDLEHAAGRGDQPDLGVGEGLLQLGRQTGGPGLVVSDDAVLDRHRMAALRGGLPPRIVAAPGGRCQEAGGRCDGAPCQSRLRGVSI